MPKEKWPKCFADVAELVEELVIAGGHGTLPTLDVVENEEATDTMCTRVVDGRTGDGAGMPASPVLPVWGSMSDCGDSCVQSAAFSHGPVDVDSRGGRVLWLCPLSCSEVSVIDSSVGGRTSSAEPGVVTFFSPRLLPPVRAGGIGVTCDPTGRGGLNTARFPGRNWAQTALSGG